jgi:CRISPR-associated endonuclease/helicase Cas3
MQKPSLTSMDFGSFFEELWGHKPYQWQQALVDQVLSDRKWPDLIDRPTGSGKTAVLDVATFVLACNACEPAELRWMPTRIVMVIDRRIVVDQAGFRGSQIAEKLRNAETPILIRVANALSLLASPPEAQAKSIGKSSPIVSGVLRGGLVRDETWAARPDRPALLVSTVDQIGSRLLFQGYGLGRSAKPIHAGLLGNDTLIILDEVHLAVPFAETLSEIVGLQTESQEGEAWKNRFAVVEMSATPRHNVELPVTVFPDPAVLGELLEDESIRIRIAASKPTRLAHYSQKKSTSRTDLEFAKVCVAELETLLTGLEGGTFGVIVNRVETAVNIAKQLKGKSQVVLLTGRMRPYDKEKVFASETEGSEQPSLLERLADRSKRPEKGITIIVGTQTLEAGADFDFDGIVTECSSRSSLVQRFGRVDRAGLLAGLGKPAKSVIVGRESSFEDDPVYGSAIGETWKWLHQITEAEFIDFGISARQFDRDNQDLRSTDPTDSFAPLTEPHHVDLWAQTSQPPVWIPDVASRLHGLGQRNVDVNVVWRADFNEDLLASDIGQSTIANRLIAVPPRSGEALQISIGALTRWLRGESAESVVDIDGAIDPADLSERRRAEPLRAFALQEIDGTWSVSQVARDLRPGATIIVPSSYGGLDAHKNWDPSSIEEVTDIAEEVAESRGRLVVRLDLALCGSPSVRGRNSIVDNELFAKISEEFDDGDVVALLTERLQALQGLPGADVGAGEATSDRLLNALARSDKSNLRVILVQGGVAPVAVANWKLNEEEELAFVDDDDEQSFLDSQLDDLGLGKRALLTEVTLSFHLAGVQAWARRFSENLSLPPHLQKDLALAGKLHDLGKIDPRFQAWLNSGSPRVGLELAKSGGGSNNARSRRLARRQSGYPKGMRHEILSLALIETVEDLRSAANDWDLVCHLVASHHGWCRPFAPVQRDVRPVRVSVPESLQLSTPIISTAHGLDSLDSSIGERYWGVTERYGWFGLAWLEAILRLADHCESQAESLILERKKSR